MLSRQIRWITALVAAGLLTAAALAQERTDPAPATGTQTPQTREQADHQRPDVKPTQKDQPGVAPRRPDVARPGRDVKEAGDGLQRTARGAAPAVAAADRKVMRKALLEEAKYRKRLAQVSRLRELTQKSGDQQRLAKLNDLEAKIKRLYEQRMARYRQNLGDEKFKSVNDRIQHGRRHRAGAAKGRPETAGRAGDARGGPKKKQGRKPQGDDRGRSPTGTPPRGKGPPEQRNKNRDDSGRPKPKSKDT